MSSDEEPPHDGGSQEQLAALAASQCRVEATLAQISRKQADTTETIARMTTDLGAVLDRMRIELDIAVDRVASGMDNAFQKVMTDKSQVSHDPSGGREFEALFSSGWQTDVHAFARGTTSDDGCNSLGSDRGRATSDMCVGLPVGWPSSVAVRENVVARPQASKKSKLTSGTTAFRLEDSEESELSDKPRPRACRRIIIDPNTSLHMAFSLCSILILGYDLIVMPFMLAWELPLVGVTMVVATGVASFWTLDVLMNFLSGYQRGGILVMDPRRIAWHYVSTWFLPDIAVLASDWLGICFALASQIEDNSTDSLRILRFTKLSRLLRVVAIFRMVKFAVVLERHVEKGLSDTYRLMIKIAGVLCGTLWLSHILACLFFVLGRSASSNTGAHWIDDASTIGDRSIVLLDEDVTYQYITSVHWTVSHITLGSMGINVSNTSERVFSIFMLLLGLLFGATMISSLSASMIDYQMLAKDKKDKLRLLRRYLRETNVDHKVALLVQQQATERLWKNARLAAKDVSALSLISVSLRTLLRFELCRPHVIRHPLFRLWTDMDVSMAKQFCTECTSDVFPMPRDDVFFPGTLTDTCYFVVFGKLNYTQVPGSSPATDSKTTSVGADQWLCEAAMWSHWIHVGTLQAETECQLLAVCVKDLEYVLRRNRSLRQVTMEYGRHFHERIASAMPPHAPWPSDISVPFTEYGDIVASMDQPTQTTISLAALERVGNSWSWHRGLEKLHEEIQKGKSTVTIDCNGDVERIVALVVMHIERRDGSIWAQLGKQTHADVACACQLPGKKQQHGELVGDTVRRIFEHLGLSERDVEILGTERRNELKESSTFGVRTKYLRTVCRARLRSDSGASRMEAHRLPERRRPSVGSRSSTLSTAALVAKAPRCEVFVRRHGCKALFYAWLTPAEFGQLQTAAGEAVLAAWLAHRYPPSEEGGDIGDEGVSVGGANPVDPPLMDPPMTKWV